MRNGKVVFKEVERIPIEEVNRLLECEINGESYRGEGLIPQLPEDVNESLRVVSDFEALIVQKENEAKLLKEQRDKYLEVIETAFRSSGIKSWETENMKITLVDSAEKRTFETKRFAEENPDMAEKYYKTTETKGYIKITLRNK